MSRDYETYRRYYETVDLRKLNSATKYPSIETYHTLKNGLLTEPAMDFEGQPVIGTEKVDGTNGRVLVPPFYGEPFRRLVGSREEWLHHTGDLIYIPNEGIVDAVLPHIDQFDQSLDGLWRLWFFEVFGGKVGGHKNYTGHGATGIRIFDLVEISPMHLLEVLSWDIQKISSWREHGGQPFVNEKTLQDAAAEAGLEVTPRLGTFKGLPQDLKGMHDFLKLHAPKTLVALDGDAKGIRAEGIVFRTEDRKVIAKARFEDYERTERKVQRNLA